jgi:Holliday junction resolvase RusA-like endonuclease
MDTCAPRTDAIVIHVAGVPRPLPRGRDGGPGKRPVSITGKAAKAWAALVEAECRRWPPIETKIVACRVSCYFPTDKAERWGTRHWPVPDSDNLAKMLTDCAVRAGLLKHGDSGVFYEGIDKWWARAGGAIMELRPWRAESGAQD